MTKKERINTVGGGIICFVAGMIAMCAADLLEAMVAIGICIGGLSIIWSSSTPE